MKNLKLAAIATAVISATAFSGQALAAVEANIGVTSDYMWRGVSQSSEAASVSGGLDYSDDSGFYLGTWVGSLGDADSGFNGAEVDLYLGYGGEADGFTYDVGYILYHYPSIDDGDFGELYLGLGYDAFSFSVAYTVNSDADDDAAFGEGDMFYSIGYSTDLTEEFSLGLTYGYYDFDTPAEAGDIDYGYFQADIGKGDFTFSVIKADEESGSDDTKFVVSWGTSF